MPTWRHHTLGAVGGTIRTALFMRTLLESVVTFIHTDGTHKNKKIKYKMVKDVEEKNRQLGYRESGKRFQIENRGREM